MDSGQLGCAVPAKASQLTVTTVFLDCSIAAAGTFIGELLCYLVFRFYATNKARE